MVVKNIAKIVPVINNVVFINILIASSQVAIVNMLITVEYNSQLLKVWMRFWVIYFPIDC